MRRIFALLPLLAIVTGCGERETKKAELTEPGPEWVIDPKSPGPNLPPEGRSLFDHLVTRRKDGKVGYDIPYPFEALRERLERRLAPDRSIAFKGVLIPLGRSLQRNGAHPDFFRSPRAVLAVDGESPLETVFARDRLFLGYQERINLIEVISYNDAAGRFEFQVVKDYGPGSMPKVFYARRQVCVICHQNQAPIFPRPLWDETNANPEVAARLASLGGSFHGVPVRQGVDVPQAIDDSTDRASLTSAWQYLWRYGCGGKSADRSDIRCREDLLVRALRYRLSGYRFGEAGHAPFPLTATLGRGLAVPTADILNRNPFLDTGFLPEAAVESGDTGAAEVLRVIRQSSVGAAFEPIKPRPPGEVWFVAKSMGLEMNRAVAGLAGMIAITDIAAIDRRLRQLGESRVFRETAHVFSCSGGEDAGVLNCRGADGVLSGSLRSEGSAWTGRVDRLKIPNYGQVLNLRLHAASEPDPRGARFSVLDANTSFAARFGTGHRVYAIGVSFDANRHIRAARVTVRDDFEAVREAVKSVAANALNGRSGELAAGPFRRPIIAASVLRQLGVTSTLQCCLGLDEMPPAMEEEP